MTPIEITIGKPIPRKKDTYVLVDAAQDAHWFEAANDSHKQFILYPES